VENQLKEGLMDPEPAPAPAKHPRLGETGAFVNKQIGRLVRTLDSPATVAALAHLREARSREPGTVPSVWALTMEGAPGSPRGDDATAEERAIHVAMTAFAAHQQSRSEPMHRYGGPTLGMAVGQLERRRPHNDQGLSPMRRRFNAVVTATSFDEVTHHLRSIVSLLRSESIPLDYARFADDLVLLQLPARADSVLRRWARDLYRLDKSIDDNPTEIQEDR
jgi:CRISPR system Cascade subunit CasB